MELRVRKLLDRSFSGLGFLSIGFMAASLLVVLVPIFGRGMGAVIFQGTVEHRRLMLEKFHRGDRDLIEAELDQIKSARAPVYDMIAAFKAESKGFSFADRVQRRKSMREVEDLVVELLGPFPGTKRPILIRDQYGETRWDRAQVKLGHLLYIEEYDYSDSAQMGRKILVSREREFRGTSLQPLLAYMEESMEQMFLPRTTFYWRFLFDKSLDAHFFGGIGPEVLGTLYLTVIAMIFAIPMGIIAAIYLVEYAGDSPGIQLLRTCISSLAGVPSIVFGLFGLAFFLNTLHISESKSVLAGSLTLALLVLPTVIRASEEAIRAVPNTYKEAALSLGAGKWWTVATVILPAALPGILTSIIISMGRAAGETAPIIFTAAVSVGQPLKIWETISQPSPALSWNIYNLATEHEAVDEIRHVQYGMVLTLVLLVLLLNIMAIVLRARISRKLRG